MLWLYYAGICLAGWDALVAAKLAAQYAKMQLFHEIQQFRTDAGSYKAPAFLAGGFGESLMQRA
jgi:hypothetical protein